MANAIAEAFKKGGSSDPSDSEASDVTEDLLSGEELEAASELEGAFKSGSAKAIGLAIKNFLATSKK